MFQVVGITALLIMACPDVEKDAIAAALEVVSAHPLITTNGVRMRSIRLLKLATFLQGVACEGPETRERAQIAPEGREVSNECNENGYENDLERGKARHSRHS